MIKKFDEFDKFNESTSSPKWNNFLSKEDLTNYWIPDTEEQLNKYKKALKDINEANNGGCFVKDTYLEKGNIVECKWNNGVQQYAQVVEFGATFKGEVFPVLVECKKDFTPTKKRIDATWLVYNNLLTLTKIQ